MFEDSPYFICPSGYDIGDDHDQHDECDTCPDNCYQACGKAFVPMADRTPNTPVERREVSGPTGGSEEEKQ